MGLNEVKKRPRERANPLKMAENAIERFDDKLSYARLIAGPWPGHVEDLDLVIDHEVQQPFSRVFHARMNMQPRLAVFLRELERFLGTARLK